MALALRSPAFLVATALFTVAVPVVAQTAASAGAQVTGGAAVVNRLAGCWSVAVTPLRPATGAGRRKLFIEPPERVDLDSIHGAGPVRGGSWALHPAAGATRSYPQSYLRVIGVDSIQLTWSTGFVGVAVKAAIVGDTLRGVAHSFTDSGSPTEDTEATLARISAGARCGMR